MMTYIFKFECIFLIINYENKFMNIISILCCKLLLICKIKNN